MKISHTDWANSADVRQKRQTERNQGNLQKRLDIVHPNPSAVLGNAKSSDNASGVSFNVAYMNTDREPLLLCLRQNAQVGVAVLKVFNIVFPDRFTEVGADSLLHKASNGL